MAPLAAVLAVAAAGCGGGTDVPRTFVDGSAARTAGVPFENADAPVLLTRERRVDLPTALAVPRMASCLLAGWSSRPGQPVVHRVGASGESLTFPSRSGRTLQACDGAGASTAARTWCGHVFGRPTAGRLRDSRLDLGGCRTSDSHPIAFVWIEPGDATRYVVIARKGFSEAYEVSGGLPVRIAVTERVDAAGGRAAVGVSEHTATGGLLREYDLEAVVSG